MINNTKKLENDNKLLSWLDERFPYSETMKEHITEYYASKNFNVWYVFGVLAMVVLVIQLLTGIFLTMNYKPSSEEAFSSVEYIMRDVEWGWLIRYMHSTGASFFFIVVYLHMFRAMLYGSYKKPRELIWIIGMLIFLVLMAEAFAGYLLPWGQMSYWGAQVIISIFGAIPFFGEALVEIIRGDYSISDITLNRFFALHVIALPLALVALIFVHIVALHEVGSNNPDGIEIKDYKNDQGIPIILSNVISSQTEVHKKFGGVVPELAARSHLEKIDWIVQKALDISGKKIDEIDAVAATAGPGLVVCLSVGLTFGKTFAMSFANL